MRNVSRSWKLTASIASLLLTAHVCYSAAQQPNIEEIVKKSVAVNDASWKAAPNYSYNEQDISMKLDDSGGMVSKQEKMYRVLMINGSPYNELIRLNGEPLSTLQKSQEQSKLRAEVKRRNHETKSATQARIEKYKSGRAEEHLLMSQMTAAFQFQYAGEEVVRGHACYVLDALPRPDYQPPVEKARVLTGMNGRMWIDKATYNWVRVTAKVIKPVEFGYFIAKVRPGTQFELNQDPVEGKVWLPVHFSQAVNARVLGFYGIRTREEEHYSDYQHADAVVLSGPQAAGR
jgi:outer membrane lipoprotein-sorting protein